MRHYIVRALPVVLMAAALLASAPPASAGCQYGGPVLSKCDGPVQPDGTWQRCVAFTHWTGSGASANLVPDRRCDVMGPDQRPWGQDFTDPPTHID
jgi:hypothetical protein